MHLRSGTTLMQKEKDEEAMEVKIKAVPIKRKAKGDDIVGRKALKTATAQKIDNAIKVEKKLIEETEKENKLPAGGATVLGNISNHQRTQRDGLSLQAVSSDCVESETTYHPEYTVAFKNIRQELKISKKAWNQAIRRYGDAWNREVAKWNESRGNDEKPLILLDFHGKDLPNFMYISQNIFTTTAAKWLRNLLKNRKSSQCTCNCTAVCKRCSKKEEKMPQVRVQPNGLFSLEGREDQNLYQAELRSSICDGSCGIVDCPQSMKTLQKFPMIIYNEKGVLSWSARAATAMPAGAYVAEYVGETMTCDNRRTRMHQFGVGNFAIDAGLKGNEARFLSHACVPNCRILPVNEKGAILLGAHCRLFIITLRPIQPGERLTIDYHAGMLDMFKEENKDKYVKITRECGTVPCRGWISIC